MTLPELPYPWERQDGESSAAFQAFVAYRDIPPLERSIQRVASDTGAKIHTLVTWRNNWGWSERVRAWDDEQDRVKRERMLRQAVKEAERVVKTAGDYQKLFAVPVREFLRRYNSDDPIEKDQVEQEIRQLSVAQLVQLATLTARPFQQMWNTQQEAMSTSTQHLLVQRSAADVESDPFRTDEEFFSRVVLAWQEAGLLPRLKPSEQKQLEARAQQAR